MTTENEPCCGHTKIKEVRWNSEQHSTSAKFMCLDCNTDFVPLTAALRRAIYAQEAESARVALAPDLNRTIGDKGWVHTNNDDVKAPTSDEEDWVCAADCTLAVPHPGLACDA